MMVGDFSRAPRDGRSSPATATARGQIKYLVLTDGRQPYLLARVRWPDIYQAVSAVRPQWQDDRGVFDLPFAPSIKSLTFQEAAAVTALWGVRLPSEDERVRGAHRADRTRVDTHDRKRPAAPASLVADGESGVVDWPDRLPSLPPVPTAPRAPRKRRTRALIGILSGAHFLEDEAIRPTNPR